MESSEYYGPVTAIGFIKNELFYACNRVVKKSDGSIVTLDASDVVGLIRKITSEFIIVGDTLYDECGKVKKSIREYFPRLLPREHILDAKTISDTLYIISTHGYVFVVDPSGETKMHRPMEASVLYSGCIAQVSEKVLFIHGTIFNGIQVYSIYNGGLKKEFTLTGHKGSIFALEVHKEFLASASDDRTVCVWYLTTHKRVFSSSGHRARIWDLCWLDENTIVSASEDADIRVWDSHSGECLQVLEGHLGKHVWCVAVHDGFVYSGGNDCSVRKWNLRQKSFEEYLWDLQSDMKSFNLTSGNIIDVGLSNGHIVRCSTTNGKIIETLAEDDTFMNYSVFEDHFVGSLDGYVLDINNKTKQCLSKDDKVCTMITSLDDLVVNYASGKIFINNTIVPDLNGTVTSFYSKANQYYIGLRDGRFIIHSLSNELIKLQKRNEAITGIIELQSVIYFCDRSGHLMTVENASITGDTKIHPGFLEALLVSDDMLLAAGFYQKNFFIFDVAKSATIFKIPCGGGHRQWQLKHFDGKLYFAYLRLKMMHVVQVPFNTNSNICEEYLAPAFHGREIRCGLVLHDILITGDEEGTLIVSGVEPLITPMTRLKGAHSNGIKAIKCIKYLIVTVGSGEELKVWRLDRYSLKLLRSLDSKENDVRFMDVVPWTDNLVVACSDGSVRYIDFGSLRLLSKLEIDCCITKLSTKDHRLFSADCQGNVHELSNHTQRRAHKNAVLAMISMNGNIITGGDDCAVSSQGKSLIMHGSSVTGFCQISVDSFASVGVDRRVVLWKGFEPVTVKMTNVDDASSIIFYKDSLIILGCGIERIKL